MLSKAEIRKLIRAHNVVSKITIPKGATVGDMVKLVEEKGYLIDHEKKVIKPGVKRGKQIRLGDSKMVKGKKVMGTDEILKPKVKTELQKQKLAESKSKKETEKKKKEREIRKKAVEEEKERKKKQVRDKLKKEPGRPRVNPKDIKVIDPAKERKKKNKAKLDKLKRGDAV